MTAIRDLIDGSDMDLCSETCGGIIDVFGGDVDASALATEYRTVLLAYHSLGIIGNGGFNYLFEGSLPGDPHFELSAEAFQTIGCAPAADAFQQALGFFPNSKPPSDKRRRLTLFRTGPSANRRMIDTQFREASDEIIKCMAAFIRRHCGLFEALDSMPRKPPKRETPAVDAMPDGPALNVHLLPHWARVAFAAHCARLVIPIFQRNWPGVPRERLESITAAIDAAVVSASEAKPAKNLDNAETTAIATVGAALGGLHGVPEGFDQNVPPDGNMASTAAHAAKVTWMAVAAARATSDESHLSTMEGVSLAWSVAEDDAAIQEQMHRDLYNLARRAEQEGWSDRSPVPVSVFDSASN